MGKFDILNYGSISCDMCGRKHTLTKLLLISFQLRYLFDANRKELNNFHKYGNIICFFSSELMGMPSLSCRIKNRSSVIQNYAIRGIHRIDDPMNNHNRDYPHHLLRQQSSNIKQKFMERGASFVQHMYTLDSRVRCRNHANTWVTGHDESSSCRAIATAGCRGMV